MHIKSVKATLWVSLIALFFSFQNADAQRLQVQLQVGANASEGFIKDNGQSLRETGTFFDTVPNAQLGIALHAKVFKNFHLRLDGNYRAYRTTFRTEEPASGGGTRYALGNLYNERFNFSLLPEYRFKLSEGDRFQMPIYAFAGPVLSVEKGKNYSDSYVIGGLNSVTIRTEIKPDAQAGWCLGAGINPKLGRWGLLAEMRYTRLGYANEGLVVGDIAYEHFTFMAGLSVDLVK